MTRFSYMRHCMPSWIWYVSSLKTRQGLKDLHRHKNYGLTTQSNRKTIHTIRTPVLALKKMNSRVIIVACTDSLIEILPMITEFLRSDYNCYECTLYLYSYTFLYP